ncbi:capsular polysaccharide biosynthesis protein [Thermogutta terrifontis]|uniref:Capsular polysaccharide biosynthesis protein n=1 Tax=Thermogutta terrifontis TaxID=1331910 RepID=A0A286RG69_9BACT|nr:glycosyltransferase [Thermogutta terrifontis]ASV74958.1 capsular polysaccharide biosynthesis protein [Thermogutta terrifontis]
MGNPKMGNRPIRVLHVLPRLSGGGVSKWLSRIRDRLDPRRFHFDFAVHMECSSEAPENLLAQGAQIYRLPNRKHLLGYRRSLSKILKNNAYDAVHTHYHFFSIVPLQIAASNHVPVRIAHAQTAGRQTTTVLRVVPTVVSKLINLFPTHWLACSQAAAYSLFGCKFSKKAKERGKLHILPGGIDPAIHSPHLNQDDIRRELNIDPNAFVVGHVGNFLEAKNHVFLLEVFRELVNRRKDACLLLVGEGPLRQKVEKMARSMGISHHIRMMGYRNDVHTLLGALDVMVFPSKWEGLPIALVEAQLCGIPIVASDNVTREVILSENLQFLSLSASPSEWASCALNLARRRGYYVDRDIRQSQTLHHRLSRQCFDFHLRAGIARIPEMMRYQEVLLRAFAFSTVSRWPRHRWYILLYHDVPKNCAEAFEKQVKWLKERFEVATISEALRRLGDARHTSPLLTITFDDAEKSVYETVLPILEGHNLKACTYMPCRAM